MESLRDEFSISFKVTVKIRRHHNNLTPLSFSIKPPIVSFVHAHDVGINLRWSNSAGRGGGGRQISESEASVVYSVRSSRARVHKKILPQKTKQTKTWYQSKS